MLEHLPQASLEHFIEERVDAAVGAVFASPEGEALRKKAIRYSRMLLDESSELQCRLFFEYEDTENQVNLLHFKECYRLGVQDAARLLRGAQEALGEKALEKKEDVRMDSKALQVFSFEKKDVRVVMKDDIPWWVAKDVCDILELNNITEALRGLDEDELTSEILKSGGQGREMRLVSESGVYTLVMRSNKPEAKRFRKWVTSEVLPQLMRTGSYSAKEKGKGRENPDDAQRLELARKRLEIQQRNTDARMAKIMQRMVESPAYALTQESKQILAHEITHLATGREHAAMLPDAGTRFYTAKQVGDAAGVSNRRVMKTAREMGLVAPEGSANEYGRWKMSKSAHGPHECAQWVFSEEGRRRVLEAIADAA